MTVHDIADARRNLEELVARARKGEDVVIMENGQAAVRLSVVSPSTTESKPMTDEQIDWLIRNRVGTKLLKEDSGTLLRRIRDEEPE